jgi:hypothetical protein
LKRILATAQHHTTKDITEDKVNLENNTMIQEVTRTYIINLIRQLVQQYNGMIEIYHVSNDVLVIRVHWNIYLSQIAARERRNHQIPLLPQVNMCVSTQMVDQPLFASKTPNHQQFQYPPINSNTFEKQPVRPVMTSEPQEPLTPRSRSRVRRRKSSQTSPREMCINDLDESLQETEPLLPEMPSPPSEDPPNLGRPILGQPVSQPVEYPKLLAGM